MFDFSALRSLWRLLAANFLLNSVVGSFMLFLPWVALGTDAPWRLAAAAAPMVITPAAYMLGSMEAGRMGDMHHPRTLMLWAAGVCGLVCAVLASASAADPTWLLLALLCGAFVVSMMTPFVDGAVARTISGSEDLVAGYAWRGAATQGGTFGGPAFALLVYGTWGLSAAMWTLTALSMLALACTLTAAFGEHEAHEGPRLKRRLGLQTIRTTPKLMRLCIISTLWNVFAIMGFALVPILMFEQAGLRASEGGLITLAGVAAAFASPFAIAALRHRWGLLTLAIVTMVLEATLVLAFGFIPSALAGIALYFVFMLLNATCSASQTAMRSLHIEPAVRSSVDVAFRTLSRLGAVAGAGLVMLLVGWISPLVVALLALAGVGILAATTLAARSMLTTPVATTGALAR